MSYVLFSKKEIHGRKVYKCVWCGERILKGQLHVFERSVYDGRYQNHRWHLECNGAAEEEAKRGECEFDLHVNDRPPHALTVEEAQAAVKAAPMDTLRVKLAMGDLHVAHARVTMGAAKDDPNETVISDMLSDLMHVCERDGISFEDCYLTAMDDHELEREELPA